MATQEHRYHQARKITLIGAGFNIASGIMKVVAGMLCYSHALIADGLHSFADFFTDIMVLFAAKYGNQDADELHPYGHQRIETAATLMLSLILILTGIAIGWDSLQHMVNRSVQLPSYFALPFAVLSVLANELLFFLTKRVGQTIESALIIANAWHHRSDSAASAVVVLGIIGSLLGYPYFDSAAAVIVGGLIVKMGIEYGWDSVKELVDTGIDSNELNSIGSVIRDVEGVCKIHQLRNRKMGPDIFVDVHVLVSPWISVSEGHQIAQRVHFNLMAANSKIKDVTVHIDPEDDEHTLPSLNLPSRVTLEKKLLNKWSRSFPGIQSVVLHYLDGHLKVEIKLEKNFREWSELELMIREESGHYPEITTVELLEQHALVGCNERKG